MRLFVAVDVSDEVRAYAEAARRAVCRRMPRLERELRWVDVRQMHVTLRFLGEVDEANADRFRLALEAPLPQPPFLIEPAEPHWLPDVKRPRVFVLGFRQGADGLRALYDTVEDRVRATLPMIEPEDRVFLPHLTLARVRDPRLMRTVPATDAAPGHHDEPRPTARIDRVTLYQSHLSPKGPTYVALARGMLTGAA
ncbi:MAG: 2'-5' ligase [Acidobacteria bacterium]|nr:2'-5' ligase [Acidobacteriota bacterium]